MHTREHIGAPPAVVDPGGRPGGRLFAGLGRTALVAVTALMGCGILIAVGTAMSLCWMIHPLLSGVAAVAIAWLASRLAGKIFSTPAARER